MAPISLSRFKLLKKRSWVVWTECPSSSPRDSSRTLCHAASAAPGSYILTIGMMQKHRRWIPQVGRHDQGPADQNRRHGPAKQDYRTTTTPGTATLWRGHGGWPAWWPMVIPGALGSQEGHNQAAVFPVGLPIQIDVLPTALPPRQAPQVAKIGQVEPIDDAIEVAVYAEFVAAAKRRGNVFSKPGSHPVPLTVPRKWLADAWKAVVFSPADHPLLNQAAVRFDFRRFRKTRSFLSARSLAASDRSTAASGSRPLALRGCLGRNSSPL